MTNLTITITLLSISTVNAAAWVFVRLRMPELTGRSLEQIEGQLQEGRFRPRDFDRLPPVRTAEAR